MKLYHIGYLGELWAVVAHSPEEARKIVYRWNHFRRAQKMKV